MCVNKCVCVLRVCVNMSVWLCVSVCSRVCVVCESGVGVCPCPCVSVCQGVCGCVCVGGGAGGGGVGGGCVCLCVCVYGGVCMGECVCAATWLDKNQFWQRQAPVCVCAVCVRVCVKLSSLQQCQLCGCILIQNFDCPSPVWGCIAGLAVS